jgi:hypothetical protein
VGLVVTLTLRLPDGHVIDCDGGCEEPLLRELAVDVWLLTGLGVTCKRTHPGKCEDMARLLEREQPARRMVGRPSEHGKALA